MAGRKHHLQQFGMPIKSLNDIEDPIERDFAYRSLQVTPYCRHCGGEIMSSLEDEDGMQVDVDWEMQNKAHYKCFMKWQAAQPKPEPVKQPEINWDDYMEQMMKQRGE